MHVRSGVVLAGLLASAWAAPLRAQNGTAPLERQCAGGSSVFTDACQKTTDLFRVLAPQLGALVAGGNATLGRGKPLGQGGWTLGLRIHTIVGEIPDLATIPLDTGRATRSNFSLEQLPLPLPMVDAALGLWSPVAVGGVTVGGLDALLNVAYLPNVSHGSVVLRVPNGSLQLGFGGRLGLVDGPGRWPALAATWIRRDLPTVFAGANFGNNGDRVQVEHLVVRTSAWRLVASGAVGPVKLDAGAGRDRARSSMNLFLSLQPPRCTYGPEACSGHPFEEFEQSVGRTQLFADASIAFLGSTLTLEVGRAGAIAIPTYNRFVGSEPGAARWEGALGIRIGGSR